MTRARHVLTILAVADLARAVAFYRRAFAWRAVVETPVYVELVDAGAMRVGLYLRDGFARNTGQMPLTVPPGAITATELYLAVDDITAAAAALVAAGARELSPAAARPWGDVAAYYADPDGNVVVVAALGQDPGPAGTNAPASRS